MGSVIRVSIVGRTVWLTSTACFATMPKNPVNGTTMTRVTRTSVTPEAQAFRPLNQRSILRYRGWLSAATIAAINTAMRKPRTIAKNTSEIATARRRRNVLRNLSEFTLGWVI